MYWIISHFGIFKNRNQEICNEPSAGISVSIAENTTHHQCEVYMQSSDTVKPGGCV